MGTLSKSGFGATACKELFDRFQGFCARLDRMKFLERTLAVCEVQTLYKVLATRLSFFQPLG